MGRCKACRGDGAGAWASGQSDSFLFGVDRICFVWCSRPLMGTASWKGRESPFPVGPFLAVGAVAAYGMKMGGRIQ